MRRAVTPAIPPSAYRHFAIVTLALTVGLAMFADGENREAQAAQVARPKPAPSATPVAFASPSATAGTQRAPHGWDDSDSTGGFGEPMQRLLGGSDSGLIPGPDTAHPSQPPADYLATLSREERERLLQEMRRSISQAPARNQR
jgi:hypothetical protein